MIHSALSPRKSPRKPFIPTVDGFCASLKYNKICYSEMSLPTWMQGRKGSANLSNAMTKAIED